MNKVILIGEASILREKDGGKIYEVTTKEVEISMLGKQEIKGDKTKHLVFASSWLHISKISGRMVLVDGMIEKTAENGKKLIYAKKIIEL